MPTATKPEMNEFRAADAFEFVDAVRACNFDKATAEDRAAELCQRMKRIEANGGEIPSYLLAAYRGYEFVIAGPWPVIKLDDRF
jgi:hypothetical protein